MSECSHDCSSCSQNCSSRQNPQDFHEAPHKLSSIKKVIGVVSGKGGVGKSMTSALMAVEMRRRGYGVGILDADITGPPSPSCSAFMAVPWAMRTASGPSKAAWALM